MRTIITSSALAVGVVVLPALASAASSILSLIELASIVLNALIGILITAAIVALFWGLVKYLFNEGEGKSDGIKLMAYGVFAIFIMVSIWGIIRLLQRTFGVEDPNAVVVQGIRPNLR